MSNSKITELTALTTPASADLIPIVDDTDTTTKKITYGSLLTALTTDLYGALVKRIVKVTTETVNNSTTLQDDDELTFSIGASEKWAFNMCLIYRSGTTPDFKLQWSLPSGCSIFYQQDDVAEAAFTEVDNYTISGAGASTSSIASFYGVILNGSTAGNITLQWAQAVQNASDTKVMAGSYIIATKLS